MTRNLRAGDQITVETEDGRQEVTVVGFQVGTGNMVIDDGTGGENAVRFCGHDEIIQHGIGERSGD